MQVTVQRFALRLTGFAPERGACKRHASAPFVDVKFEFSFQERERFSISVYFLVPG